MKKSIGAISLLVRDYNEAISFYVDKLGFHLMEDTDMGAGALDSDCASRLRRGLSALGKSIISRTTFPRWKPDGWTRLPLPPHKRFLA